MKVDQPPAARALVQIVDVLGHQHELALPPALQLCERQMGGIGRDRRIAQPGAALVVEAMHQVRIAGEGTRRGHFLDAPPLPQAAGATKGGQSGLGRDAGAGQHDDGSARPSHGHEATPAENATRARHA